MAVAQQARIERKNVRMYENPDQAGLELFLLQRAFKAQRENVRTYEIFVCVHLAKGKGPTPFSISVLKTSL